MKGKKLDIDFISTFIIKCAQNNHTTPQEVCYEAKRQINCIDAQLQVLDNLHMSGTGIGLKQSRILLGDVLVALKDNLDITADHIILPFFNLPDKDVALKICHHVLSGADQLPSEDLFGLLYRMQDLSIIIIKNGTIQRGPYLNQFVQFVGKYYGQY
jgi:hypothetical protein